MHGQKLQPMLASAGQRGLGAWQMMRLEWLQKNKRGIMRFVCYLYCTITKSLYTRTHQQQTALLTDPAELGIRRNTMNNKIKIQADNFNGVYVVEAFEGEVLSQEDFYESLDSNQDESVICAEVDQAHFDKIKSEYGIS